MERKSEDRYPRSSEMYPLERGCSMGDHRSSQPVSRMKARGEHSGR